MAIFAPFIISIQWGVKLNAIYVRQSVDKKDSISIESQIEACRRRLTDEELVYTEVFEDRGFSGKSTNRPSFQKMMNAIKEGSVKKVISYKLDRISRSLLDFLQIQQVFNQFGTEFISCTEDFDTSTPNGKMMVNMLMAFAEMERETIQKRITDNYYARGESGFYLGGYAPFGYKKIETHIDGKKTYTFAPVDEEVGIVMWMFTAYINGDSMISIARNLNEKKIPTRKNKAWSQNHISRMLKNPLYVKANADVYDYLKAQGANMNNGVEDYIGDRGCMLYGNVSKRKGTKFSSINTDFITLGMHEGIIDSQLWLEVQYLIKSKIYHSNQGTGALSWLQGLVKCECGANMYVVKCKNKNKTVEDSVFQYFYCRNRKTGTCSSSSKMMQSEVVETIAKDLIFARVRELSSIKISDKKIEEKEINLVKIKISQIDTKIENLISQIASGSPVVSKYLNDAIGKFDAERNKLANEVLQMQLKENRGIAKMKEVSSIESEWNGYSTKEKQAFAKRVISVATISSGTVVVEYN